MEIKNAKDYKEIAEIYKQVALNLHKKTILTAIENAAKIGKTEVDIYEGLSAELLSELEEKEFKITIFDSGLNETAVKISWK